MNARETREEYIKEKIVNKLFPFLWFGFIGWWDGPFFVWFN